MGAPILERERRPVSRARDEGRVAEAARLYLSGMTRDQVAAQMGVRGTTVSRWLGNEVRRRGPRRRPVPDAKILDMRDRQGLSYRQISALTGMSASGVRQRYWAVTGRPRADRHPV